MKSTTILSVSLGSLLLGFSLVILVIAHDEARQRSVLMHQEAHGRDFVRVELLRPGLWIHTSWHYLPGMDEPTLSNGMIIQHGDSLWLVDTSWGNELTEELFRWIEREIQLPVAGAVVSHFHDDRMGGSGAVAALSIPVWAHPLTIQLALDQSTSLPLVPLPEIRPGEAIGLIDGVEVFYPGRGHSHDNVMVWLTQHRVLYGGCTVRPATTRSLGNTEDADLDGWSQAIRRAQEEYRDAQVVVPGHGPLGGPGLLEHTLLLLGESP